VFSPVQSSEASNVYTESSRQLSSISSTLSVKSEVDKCKIVIFDALNLKKQVSVYWPVLKSRLCIGLNTKLLQKVFGANLSEWKHRASKFEDLGEGFH